MATRVALNDAEQGQQFAIIKDVNELNAGDRRAVRGAVPVSLASDGKSVVYAGDYDDQMKNALLARIIKEWNLAWPVPQGDASILDELSIDQIDRLYDAVAAHVEFLNKKVPNPAKEGTDPTVA